MSDNLDRKKPGRKPGSTHVDENERRLTKTFRLPRRQVERLKKEKNASALISRLLDVYWAD